MPTASDPEQVIVNPDIPTSDAVSVVRPGAADKLRHAKRMATLGRSGFSPVARRVVGDSLHSDRDEGRSRHPGPE